MYTIEEIKIKLLNNTFAEFQKNLNEYNINEFDKFGNNILHYFIKNESVIKIKIEELLPELINRGFDINVPSPKGQHRTPLYLAVSCKSKTVFEALINSGANINAVDVNGNSPLSQAIMNYKGDDGFFIEKLISDGADINLKNKYGHSPISLANTIVNYDIKFFFR